MTVTTNDARAKYVYEALVDKVSTMYPLSSLGTDMGAAMKEGESIDIVTRAAVSIEAATSAGTATSMTVQTISPTANNLVVDQHYGAIVGIAKFNGVMDMGGAYYDQLARQILVELADYIDQDWYDDLIRVGAYSSSAAFTANVAGDALTVADTEQAMAIMTDQKGVREGDLVWVFGPYGAGSLRSISAFTPHENAVNGALGMPIIGTLHGVPVVRSQSVPKSLAIATTQAVSSSDVVTFTVASGHGFVPGMVCVSSGLTSSFNGTFTITSVTATTIVGTVTGSGSTTAGDGVGTITCSRTFNGLIHRPWNFIRKRQVPDLRIVPTSGKIQDELQADAIWGVKSLAGSCVTLLSPATSVT